MDQYPILSSFFMNGEHIDNEVADNTWKKEQQKPKYKFTDIHVYPDAPSFTSSI